MENLVKDNEIMIRANGEIVMTQDYFVELFKNRTVSVSADVVARASMALISRLIDNFSELEVLGEISSVADVLDYLDSLTTG